MWQISWLVDVGGSVAGVAGQLVDLLGELMMH